MELDRLLRLTAEQTTEHGVLLLDPRGTILWCNQAASDISGHARDALTGRSVHVLFTPEDVQEGVADHELAVAAASGDMHNDRWLMRADGSRFWASGITTGLRDEDGTHIGFGKIFRDATDVKEQLETLRSRADALLSADQHKNIFLSTLSHELRNPLAPLTNALHLMRLTAPADNALEYPMKLIERQVDFIRRLVDDLLDVTRISAGKIQLDRARIDLRDVLARSRESSAPVLSQRKHRLVEHILGSPIVVNADPARLEQVFVNLLTNAAKYTPEGGEIEVRATMEQNEAIVHVRDNGIGIPTDMLPRIFDLFTQVDESSQRTQGGLGIGLALVKNLVEVHGGSVQVRSDGTGKGSEFTVRLPLAHPRSA